MKPDTDYKKRDLLLKAAKDEFVKKGYTKASLRTICAKAGVTTGALYFFFENKAELFAAVVDPPLNELKGLLTKYFIEDAKYLSSINSLDELETGHNDASELFTKCIYENHDVFRLLLTRSENTVYENTLEDLSKLIESLIPSIVAAVPGYTYDPFMLEFMAHLSLDSYINIIRREPSEKKAAEKLKKITYYLIRGWVRLVMIKEE
ncbi:MAG: TetR/AcrR family transcriptional regulator [Lachnospiraceae bacterium]|nr:TetR/AcrR family transcriptional regulator [Lachnospiraceae bacterium]